MKIQNLLWILPFSFALSAQNGSMSASSPSWNGLDVQFVSKVEPAGTGVVRLPGAVFPAQDWTHRVISDVENRRKFGYDLILEPLGDPQTARLRIEPLNQSGQGPKIGIEPGWTMLAPPRFPILPVVHVGDTVAIDLMINPRTGQKIVDYLTIGRNRLDTLKATVLPRDFTVDDVELIMMNPRVWVNGKLVETPADFMGGITAHVLWIYLPGTGSFEFSLWPEPALGFQKIGTVAANTLTFRSGANDYRVECSGPVAPGSGLFNLYVLSDPGFTMGRQGPAEFTYGGADKAEYLIRKR